MAKNIETEVVRIKKASSFMVDSLQHTIQSQYKKRIPKQAIIGLAIEQLQSCATCEKKFRNWVLAYKK